MKKLILIALAAALAIAIIEITGTVFEAGDSAEAQTQFGTGDTQVERDIAAISTDIGDVQTDVDAILIDTSTTLDDYIDTEVADILTDTGTSLPADIAAVQADTDALQLEIPSTDTWGDGASADASAGQNVIANFVDTVEADVAGVQADTDALQLEIPSTDTWGDGNDVDASAGQNSIYNGVAGTVAAVNRRAGNRQVFVAGEATLACNGGLNATIATATTAPVVIDSVVVYGNADLPGADCVMQVQCGVGGNDQVVLEYGDADIAVAGDTASSLDAATGLDTTALSATDTCRVINTAGTNAGTQDVTVIITYYAASDGGFLAP